RIATELITAAQKTMPPMVPASPLASDAIPTPIRTVITAKKMMTAPIDLAVLAASVATGPIRTAGIGIESPNMGPTVRPRAVPVQARSAGTLAPQVSSAV